MAVTLGYAIFFAADLDRSIRFYRDSLGIPLRFSTDLCAEFQTDGAKFALYSRAHLPELIGREAPPGPVPWPQGEIAFLVEDPDAEYERTVHLSDPDGNVVELTRPRLYRHS
jgi:lactoylglutathione lyase